MALIMYPEEVLLIWTIGYQRLAPARLAWLAERLDALVVDVRAVPKTRIKGYGTNQLLTLLGARYTQMGHCLGGRGSVSAEGIDFLRRGDRFGRDHILMCACHVPGDCHRHTDICGPHFPKAVHLFEDEAIEAGELERSIRDGDEYTCYDVDDFIEEAAS